MRKNSYAIQGGSFGDEGKGRVVDEICSRLIKKHKELIVYRWNGGANAGHTVVIRNNKLVLHQIPSGVTIKGVKTILGKGMVLHPADLVQEIQKVKRTFKGEIPAELIIDEMAVLTLDTHRVFEASLKDWEEGGSGSTGRGIAPAYADILLRHPLRARDLLKRSWKKSFAKHFDLYKSLVKGLGTDLTKRKIKRLGKKDGIIGNRDTFLKDLAKNRKVIKQYIKDASEIVFKNWNKDTPFVFEGAQGVGLDPRWGVYPDVTSSDPTFAGILNSTSGIVNPVEIATRVSVYKATYMSSVGKRRLPTIMDGNLAEKIRKEANEYGATTGRPRDICYVDIPALAFFIKVTEPTHMVLTHLDISYSGVPIKVCTDYSLGNGKRAGYVPDQNYLDNITPIYEGLPSWNGKDIQGENNVNNLPRNAKKYIYFMAYQFGLEPLIATTGPERSSFINLSL